MSATATILLAEDDELDVMLLRRAFASVELNNPLEFAHDGQHAIEWLEQRLRQPELPLPALVLLDLKMPRRDGLQTLRWMRSQSPLRCVPAIIFSSSAHRHEVRRAYEAGANAFLVKPPSLAERAEVARFIKHWLHLNQVAPCDAG
ncbi:MAG: two-component system response regulator [Opitutus sp.]|nr:two-component system response regulator [Opitutus sp.]